MAASSIKPTVRLLLKSESAVKTPMLPRSGGISVRLIQPPLAYSIKIVAWLDRGVHVGHDDAVSILSWTRPWRRFAPEQQAGGEL